MGQGFCFLKKQTANFATPQKEILILVINKYQLLNTILLIKYLIVSNIAI